jgi:hypothetical protein
VGRCSNEKEAGDLDQLYAVKEDFMDDTNSPIARTLCELMQNSAGDVQPLIDQIKNTTNILYIQDDPDGWGVSVLPMTELDNHPEQTIVEILRGEIPPNGFRVLVHRYDETADGVFRGNY